MEVRNNSDKNVVVAGDVGRVGSYAGGGYTPGSGDSVVPFHVFVIEECVEVECGGDKGQEEGSESSQVGSSANHFLKIVGSSRVVNDWMVVFFSERRLKRV